MKLITIPKKYIASFLALVMVFGVFVFVAPVEAQAVEINANATGFGGGLYYSDESGVTSFANGAAIKVVNLMRTSKNEATYTTTDGTNWTTSDAFVWNSSSKNTFQAWYPVAEYSSYDAFTIPTDQGDATKLASADWMTASTGEIDKPGNGVLDLSFQHRLAKVTVTVSEFTSQYAEGATLSGATIYSLTADNVSVENADNGVTPYQEGNSVTAIVCPGKYNADATLMEINVKDENGNYTLAVPVNDYLVNTGLAAGSHYTFSLKVGKDVVAISSVTVEGWVEMEIDGGVAEEVPQTYTYDATTNTYKVYQGDYLQTAIDEAEVTGTAENPATVKIMADMEITGVPDENGLVVQNILVDAGVIILDLNGHLVKGMTDRHGINITDYATLTIDDSSESKQGKFMCKDHVLYMDEHAKLIINNGTFENWAESYDELEGVVLRGLGWDWSAIINGGTFVSVNYVIMMSATVEINGGTFIGENYALDISNGSNEPININGGSFVGGNYDLFIYSEDGAVPAFLSANAETGVGATFPGGLTIDYDEPKTLNDIIMDGVGYFDAEGNQITEGLDGTNIAGDVTVKRIH